jgi:hypothetical protein
MSDTDYFYRRAETELKLAERATEGKVVEAHYKLAQHYLDRVYGEGEIKRLEALPENA